MILNAAAVQRGLAHGSLYKTDAVDLAEERGKQLVRRWACGLVAGCAGNDCPRATGRSCGHQSWPGLMLSYHRC